MDEIIQFVRSNPTHAGGIELASNYVNAMTRCFGNPLCASIYKGLATESEWNAEIKAAANRLAFAEAGMLVEGGQVKLSDLSHRNFGGGFKGKKSDESKSILDFDFVLTSNRKDRDGDILEPGGAEVDPRMPVLLYHLPTLPIGKWYGETGRDSQLLRGSGGIADTQLGHDAATLVEFGALRISHGFVPVEFKPLKANKDGSPSGFHITKFTIYEVSLVSVPSNEDAIVEAWSKGKLSTTFIKGMAEGLSRQRPSTVVGGFKCACQDTPKDAKLVAKYYGPSPSMPALEGSWEDVQQDLSAMVPDTLKRFGLAGTNQQYPFLFATFDNYAVACVWNYAPDVSVDNNTKFYRLDWTIDESGEPQFVGMPQEVEVEATIAELDKSFRAEFIKAGKPVSAKNMGKLQDAHDLIDEVASHGKTTLEHREQCGVAMKCLKSVIGGDDKAGRVLSQANHEMVQKAHDLCGEMVGHKDMHKSGRAMLREAKTNMREVLDDSTESMSGGEMMTADDQGSKLLGLLLQGKQMSLEMAMALRDELEQQVDAGTDRLVEELVG